MASGNMERHGRVQEYLGSWHTSSVPGAKCFKRNTIRGVLIHGGGGWESDGVKVVTEDRWLSKAANLSPMGYTWCMRKLEDCGPQL